MSDVIVDGGSYPLPLSKEAIFRIEMLDDEDRPVVPDNIHSMAIYRSERGSLNEDSDLYHVVGLVGGDNAHLWDITQQNIVRGYVENRKFKVTLSRMLLDKINHHWGQDSLVLGDTQMSVDQSIVTLTSVGDKFVAEFDMTNLAEDGIAASLVYATAPFGGSVRMVADGVFDFLLETSSYRFWPGTHYVFIEAEKDDEPIAVSSEFRMQREGMGTSPSSKFSEDFLRRILMRQMPRMFPDNENGIDGPSGEKFQYVQRGIEEMRVMVDAISDAWGIETAPASLLEYIAAEYGAFLVGNDQVAWRQQVSDLILRWKAKGSIKGIRERLKDCGVELEKFTRFFQVRPRKFQTLTHIITRNTEWTALSDDFAAKIWNIPMAKAPWVFPASDSGRTEFTPAFAILEARQEGTKSWMRVPAVVDGHAILRFHKSSDGSWKALISPDKIVIENESMKLVPVDDRLRIFEFTEIRITYPSAPWGVVPFERTLSLAQLDPSRRRSGPAVVSHPDHSTRLTIGLQDGIASTTVYMPDGSEAIVNGPFPPPRLGYSVIHYAEGKLVLFGGITEDGKFLDDTWILNFADINDMSWTKSASKSEAPSPRSGALVIATRSDDALETRHFLFGGYGQTNVLGDTWQWSVDTEIWSQVSQQRLAVKFDPLPLSSVPTSIGQTVTTKVFPSTSGINIGDSILLFNPEDPYSGYITATILSINGNDVELDITDSGGQYDFGYPTNSVIRWSMAHATEDVAPVVEIQDITVMPSNALLRAGNLIELHHTTTDNVVQAIVLNRIGTYDIRIKIIGETMPVSGPYVIVVKNLEPSPRCGAASIPIATTPGGAITMMLGGWGDDMPAKDDIWAFSHESGWLQLWPSNDGPAGFCINMIHCIDDLGKPTIVVGGGSHDYFPSGDQDYIGLRPSSWYELEGAYSLSGVESLNTTIPGLSWKKTTMQPSPGQVELFKPFGALPVHDSLASSFAASDYTFSFNSVATAGECRMRGVYSVTFDVIGSYSAVLTFTRGADVFPKTEIDAFRPIALGSVEKASNNAIPNIPYATTSDQDIVGVYADSSSFDSVRFSISDPEKYFADVSGESFWNIMPDTEIITKSMLGTPIAADGVITEGVIDIAFFPSAESVFEVTTEMMAFCPLVNEGDKVRLVSRVHDMNDTIAGYMAVTENNDVLTDVNGILASVYSGGILKLSTDLDTNVNLSPMSMTAMMSAGVTQVAPLSGSYARIDDKWHRLVSVSEGRMPSLTLHTNTDESFDIDQNDFAVVLDADKNVMKIWIVSEDKPDMGDIIMAELEGFFPNSTRKLPPVVSRWSHKAYIESPGDVSTPVNLAWGPAWPESLNLEPAIDWLEPKWIDEEDAIVLLGGPISNTDDWYAEVVLPNGELKIIPPSMLSFRKIMRRSKFDTTVEFRILPESGIRGHGLTMRLTYPMRSSVKLRLDRYDRQMAGLDEWTSYLGFGDYRGQMSVRQFASTNFGTDETVLSIKVASARSAGYDGNVVVDSYLVSAAQADLAHEKLEERPFEYSEAYHAPDDSAWKIDGKTTWPSARLDYVIGDDDTLSTPRERKLYSSQDLPRYSKVYGLWLYTLDGVVPPNSDEPTVRIGLSVSTISSEHTISDLLMIAASQARISEFKDSRFGLADWVDLYVLSLPRADERMIDTLETYKDWRRSVVAEITPAVYPSPPVDHETRLMDRDDPYLSMVCPEINSGASPVVFGRIRSAVPFGSTVFNRDEYDGSTKPSIDPCDIDVSFIEDCDCAPASHVSWSVRLDVSQGVTDREVRMIMDEMLPAHAVTRSASFRHIFSEPARRTAEKLFHIMFHKINDAIITFNPSRPNNGQTFASSPLWTQFMSETYPAYHDSLITLTADTSGDEDSLFVLLAPEADKSKIPFGSIDSDLAPNLGTGGEMAFALTDNDSKMLAGVRRYGESTFMFRSSVDGGGSPSPKSDYSIWNITSPEDEYTFSTISETTWVSFDKEVLDGIGVEPGQDAIFLFAPDPLFPSSAPVVTYYKKILSVQSTDFRTWVEIDEPDPSTNMPLLYGQQERPASVVFSRDGSLRASQVLRFRNDLLGPRAPIRGRIMQVVDLPMNDQQIVQDTILFDFGRTALSGCLTVSKKDIDRFGNLFTNTSLDVFDPGSIGSISEGSIVDAFGSIVSRSGQIVADFVIVDTNVKMIVADEVSVLITDASLSGQRVLSVDFSQAFDKLYITDFTYVAGATSSYDDGLVRVTASMMPRSTSSEYDLDDRYFLFFGSHYLDAEWTPQTSITLRRVATLNAISDVVKTSIAKTGDYVFIMNPWAGWLARIIDVNLESGIVKLVVADRDDPLPNGLKTAQIGHRSIVSKIPGDWKPATRSLLVSTDILALMPSGYQDYGSVPALVNLRHGDNNRLPILEASMGPTTGTTLFRMARPAYLDEAPIAPSESVKMTIYDPTESDAVADSTRGGSKIVSKVFQNNELIDTQEFNG